MVILQNQPQAQGQFLAITNDLVILHILETAILIALRLRFCLHTLYVALRH
jgi:hypothetical protein